MLKNVKLGAKMIGGFVLVAAIVLAVGFFGWNGARQLQGHIDEIGSVRLPSVAELEAIKAEANEIRAVVRTMLNPRISADEKARQYEDLAASRVRYEASWETFEAIPQSAEEQRLWGEFEAAWNAWREVNNRVVEMAREIDQTDILNPDALATRVVGFIRDHHVLMEQTLQLLVSGQQFEGGEDPTACAFGRWLGGFSTSNPRIDALLTEVHTYHDPFHEAVGRIKTLVAGGSPAAALSVFESQMQPSAEGVFRVFDDLDVEVQRVVGLYDSMNELAFGDAVVREGEAISLLDSIVASNETDAAESVATAHTDGARVEMIALIGIIVGVVLAIVLGVLLTRAITVPVSKGVRFAEQIARGELDITLDVEQQDEIGVLADALRKMLESLRYKAQLVERVAAGDLTVNVEVASEHDGLGQSLVKMVDSLNDILGQVQTAVDQVAAGAAQVSSASQDLSQGATEQASSLEEITSSITEVNGQSSQNTQSAAEASKLSRQAADDAESGRAQMGQLREAMGSIASASDEIKKVVKVIDDIAFQINLLALNANVEAARAGKYGKGFAVVAEEVRNLAVRSAEAVKETTAMVEQSVTSIEAGNKLSDTTAEQLEGIVGGAARVAQFLEEIAAASREQSLAIEQISEGLGQVDQVTQANTASAEESASASEELSSQAEQLRGAVATFKLRRIAQAGPALGKTVGHARIGHAGNGNGHAGNGHASGARRPADAKTPSGATSGVDDTEFDRF